MFNSNEKGFSLVEILVTLAIFSIISAIVFEAYRAQVRHTTREYRVAEAEIEIEIAKGIIERDLNLAGYGLAEDYDYDNNGTQNFTPRVAGASDGSGADWDSLILMGTALGLKSRQAQGWTYVASTTPTFQLWSDVREDVGTDDRVILMEPSTKKLLAFNDAGTWKWLFKHRKVADEITAGNRLTTVVGGTTYTNPSVGTLLYGLHGSTDSAATQPYYAVRYYKGSGSTPSNCASGTESLLRAEDRTSEMPTGGDPIMDCVLDMEVAFGLDTNGDGKIDMWDNGGATAGTYDTASLRKRLKHIRMYILVQSSNYDPDYTYPLTSVRVGDSVLGTGRDVALTAAQRNYKWKLVAIQITPRNIR